jgi:hypothetical protein
LEFLERLLAETPPAIASHRPIGAGFSAALLPAPAQRRNKDYQNRIAAGDFIQCAWHFAAIVNLSVRYGRRDRERTARAALLFAQPATRTR